MRTALPLLLAALFAAPAPAQSGPGSQRPNVVVILMDDVGRDKVGAYGDATPAPPTPNMDALAAQGVLFRNAWSYPVCSPTRAALLTGRSSDRTGIGDVIRPSDGVDLPLSTAEHTLPDALPDHSTFATGKWHLQDTRNSGTHALACGFDHFAGWSGQNAYFTWTQNFDGNESPQTGYYPLSNGFFAQRAIYGLPEPYFVYYAPFLAHAPFHTPPAAYHTQAGTLVTNAQRHFAMVETLDFILGRVLSIVDLDETYVFLIGDNGSPGSTVVPPFTTDTVKGSFHGGGVRVPFIVAGPGVAEGTECDALVQVEDVFATVREITGYGPPTQGADDSISFAPLLANPQAAGARPYNYAHLFPVPGSPFQRSDDRAIRTDRWKLIDLDGGNEQHLYDLVADPLEQNDLLAGTPSALALYWRNRLLSLMP